MADGICSVVGCTRSGRLARGMCLTHYARWRKYGHTDDPQPPTLEERWLAMVDRNGPVPEHRPELGQCWVWTGETNQYGYGRISVLAEPGPDGKRRRKRFLAHRWGYQHFVGPFPEHLEVDHLCFNPLCVNYESHLEPVTKRENVLRNRSPWAANARKTSCDYGHEFTPENTRVTSQGKRECIKCAQRREANRAPRDWAAEKARRRMG